MSLGANRTFWWQLAVLPWRIYRLACHLQATHFISASTLFYWWLFLPLRCLHRARVLLLPVYLMHEIYRSQSGSITGLPRWLERLFTWLSFFAADSVVVPRAFGSFVSRFACHSQARRKLRVVDTLVDALPSLEFFQALGSSRETAESAASTDGSLELLYVGRLEQQKMVGDLLEMLCRLRTLRGTLTGISLTLIGDGTQRESLEERAVQLGIRQHVHFKGFVQNADLPRELHKADVFVSPLTGTSLREAALCGLPVVAYDMDWIHGFLQHGETALLVPRGDVEGLAQEVSRLCLDAELRQRLGRNIHAVACRLWSPEALKASLTEAFGLRDSTP